ncbi:hypothetical protein [Aquibacillus sediminis]|nr:hypothetical protein [Aquibacillus sediminis]
MEETLQQILSELQNVNQRMDGFDKHFDHINNDMKELKDGKNN